MCHFADPTERNMELHNRMLADGTSIPKRVSYTVRKGRKSACKCMLSVQMRGEHPAWKYEAFLTTKRRARKPIFKDEDFKPTTPVFYFVDLPDFQ